VSRQRLDVKQAAEVLGISSEGVRKRIKRGSLDSEKSPEGKVYVWLDSPDEGRTNGRTGSDARSNNNEDLSQTVSGRRSDALLNSLEDQVSYLRDQLALEREANRENRRLLAAALERIPELESSRDVPSQVPPEPRETSETAPRAQERATTHPRSHRSPYSAARGCIGSSSGLERLVDKRSSSH